MLTPPRAATRDYVRTQHGDQVKDEFAWFADTADPEFRAYLEAENAYADEITAPLAEFRERLVGEIKSRVKETDLSVPVSHRGWWYYSRTQEGHQYGAECRVADVPGEPMPRPEPGCPLPGEQVLVDGEVEAAGSDYLALGACEVSPDSELVAFAVDRAGDERFDVVVRRIEDGTVVDATLTGVGYGLVWSADSSYLVYVRVDEAWRPHEVWLHRVGTDPTQDELLLTERDERFWLGIGQSRDERWLVVSAASKSTSECWLGDLELACPKLVSVAGRREGLEYDIEPDREGLFITHNATSPDFEVSWTSWQGVAVGGGQLSSDDPAAPEERWVSWLAPRAGVRFLGVDAFAGQVVVSLREGGLPSLRLARHEEGGLATWDDLLPLAPQEELFSISLAQNPSWRTDRLRVVYESFVTPKTVAEIRVSDISWTVLKQQEVLGGYRPERYVQSREWATAEDGTAVPLSIVRRADVDADGTAPAFMMVYGAYELSVDPWFSALRLSMLDRGVVFAVAHVRGGGEMGRSWYEQGRFTAKPTTFSDTVACARHLQERGWVAPGRLILQGGSAGGLTVGAAMNAAPELFAVVHADVPFVDPLTSMLDESLPLTVAEWEEWGNPVADQEIYACMKGYSPYENLRQVSYPAVLATTSLNDTRVLCTEPAKWVARLRSLAVEGQAPVLLRTDMSAGHGGRSGRYDAWRQYAYEAAFVLSRVGVTA
ncbi:oligopeptidase B [Austwickia chelonae]|uniref:Oligopeptidase B n=1 Tax=Austwickia chelonae NBRC 105200 TaxID=1184607 RepID=K6VM55_9MICO|nr:S9 family peptidase [Austwickia chelonae]GAB76465.1 oligopeptidase B [Austwickia chelonae NBRC 105200]SEW25170.1 oligopeptidase B [Austwickia chelonae]